MHITQIETLCLSRPHEPENQWATASYKTSKADCAIVVIHTDAGLAGIGEASPNGVPPLIREWVNWLAHGLIGRDPSDLSLAPQPNGRVPAGDPLPVPPHDCAAAAIDTALWDLRGNKRLTIPQSFEIARELDRLGFAWFEEPFPLSEIDAYAELSATVSLPITGGEQLTTLEEFKPYLEKHALGIVQPDVSSCGLSEALRIAGMAGHYGVALAPPNCPQRLFTLAPPPRV